MQNIITCPNCGSTKARSKGLRNGKNRFLCKDCGKYYTIDLTPIAGQVAAEEEVPSFQPFAPEVVTPTPVAVAPTPVVEARPSAFPAPDVKANRVVMVTGQRIDFVGYEREIFMMAQNMQGDVFMDEAQGVYVIKPRPATKG